MAEIPSVYKLVILFALIACHAIFLAEGRPIKLMNKEESTSVRQESQRKTEEVSSINLHQSTAVREEEFHPTQPRGHITAYDIAGKKEIFPPNVSLGDSAATCKDDFRPTTLGNSPGVGHLFAEDQENVESTSAEQSFKGFPPINDTRTTIPGHSPGVGHALLNKKAEPNA